MDTELCVELANDVDRDADAEGIGAAIGRCWPALEIVDLARRAGEPDSIVVDIVIHRAVAVGDEPVPLACAEQVTTYVNGECADQKPWPVDVPDRLVGAAALLAVVNERIRAATASSQARSASCLSHPGTSCEGNLAPTPASSCTPLRETALP